MVNYRTCPVIDKFLKSLNGQQREYFGLNSKAAIECLLTFLAFIVKSPTLYSQFKTFVNDLTSLIDLVISSVQLLIAQISVSLDILNAIISPFKALQEQLSGFLGMMPFKEFASCPPVAEILKYPQMLYEGALSSLGKLPPLNKYKNVKEFIRLCQWRIEQLEKIKKDLLDTLERLKSIKLLFKALLDAIDQCFKDIKFPPA